MKKISLLLVCLMFLGACSSWTLPKVNLNPFSEWKFFSDKESAVHVYENVNPFLWKAAYDKLAFLGFQKNSPAQGLLETNWSMPEKDERLQIQVWINSGKLSADSLQVAVLKQIQTGGKWENKPTASGVAEEIKKAILLRARDLYKNSMTIQE